MNERKMKMKQTKYANVNLPVVGRVQHGEKIEGKGAKELGYFIVKIQDTYMQEYLEKFNKQYKGKKSIDIQIFNEEPLTIKYARFNQRWCDLLLYGKFKYSKTKK